MRAMSAKFNKYAAQVGDKIEVKLTYKDESIRMTVYAIHAAGSAGTSHASGPQVMAWIQPGGYGLNLNDASVESVVKI